MDSLETRRLILRPVTSRDLETFVAFYGDPAVMAIRKFGVLNRDSVVREINNIVEHWERHGFGMCAVIEQASQEFAGECGLRWLEDGTEVELSYGLYPQFHGRGLATEAARSALRHGFEKLGLKRIVALSRGDNAVSHRVLKKLGMELLWRKSTGSHGLVKYTIDSAAWKKKK